MEKDYDPPATCPHCIAIRLMCCQCQGTRVVLWSQLPQMCVNVWAKPGCSCEVCTFLRHTRKLILDLERPR